MYDLGGGLDTEVEPGTNILISGPPLSGKRSLALDILATGTRNDEGAIVVTTKDNAKRILKDYDSRVSYDGKPVAVVDCVTRQQGLSDISDGERVRYTSSPVDMTGIGIKLSELLQTFNQERGVKRNRIMVNSLSTLLMYSNLQTVFRFLHVFTGRIQSVDALGVFCIESTAHDERTMSTLKQLFDGMITTHEDDEPTVQLS